MTDPITAQSPSKPIGETLGGVQSRKEKRKALKKLKRKQIRKEAAIKEREEEEAVSNDPEEQLRIRSKEQEEAEIAERARKEFEERERIWLEAAAKRKAEEEERRKQEILEESERRKQEQKRKRKRNQVWSDCLPSELVAEIMSRLTCSGDRVRFAGVCPSWRRVASPSWRSAKSKKPQHPPWLMLPGPEGVEDEHRSLYSLSERKFYRIHLPQIQGQQCIGSGEGWIVTLNNLTGQLQLQLLHLLNGNGSTSTTTTLPSVTTFSDVSDVGVFDDTGRLTGYMCRTSPEPLVTNRRLYFRKLEDMHYLFKKVVFFPSASLVFVIYNVPPRLAFARIGDEFWNEFDVDCSCIRDVAPSLYRKGEEEILKKKLGTDYCLSTYCLNFCDVVFHKGQFYAICSPGWFLALHLADNAPPKCTCLVLRPPPCLKKKKVVHLTSYLVESPDGEELMQVQRYIKNYISNKTISFTVFKCKLSGEGGGGGGQEAAKWVEVKCLGEWVLFLGENLSLALSTKDFPELTPNSIYFTQTRVNKKMSPLHLSDMGVFHLDGRFVEPVLDDKSSLLRCMTWPLPVWIPHAECFPLVTQFKEYMVEEIKKRRIVPIKKIKRRSVFFEDLHFQTHRPDSSRIIYCERLVPM